MRWRLCWRLLLLTLRLQFITVIPAVLTSIADSDLGDTLVPALTTEQEVRTVLVSALTDSGLVTAVTAVWPAVTNLTTEIKISKMKYPPSDLISPSL